MSLSGNLGFVSLDEVLRLLTRSKQSGAVEVKGDSVQGRIYVGRSGVGLATTFGDDTLRRHLTRSGLVDPFQVDGIAAGTTDLGSLPEADAVTGLLREMSVESLYQLSLNGVTFQVTEGDSSPFAAPGGFDLEELLADSRQRLTEWEEVRTIVSDMERELRLRKTLGEREKVTLDRDSWRLVAEMGNGASIRGLADQLGTTEFWTARVAAGLVEDGLLSMEESAAAATAGAVPGVTTEEADFEDAEMSPAHHADEEPAAAETYAALEDESIEDPFAEADELGPEPEPEPEPVFETVMEAEVQVEAEAAPDFTPAAEGAEPSDPFEEPEFDPNQSWWKEPEREAKDTEVEEDTESFLEKVFSELEPEPEQEEGYGLLRRRRMGTLRDVGNG